MSEPVASSEDRCYRFGGFDFDARALALRKGGRILRARPQSLKLLTLLHLSGRRARVARRHSA